MSQINENLIRQILVNYNSLRLHGEQSDEKPLFNSLKSRKQSGEHLELEDITPIMMRQLWWEEICFDYNIATLFDNVIPAQVKAYRYSMGIKMQIMDALDRAIRFERY